MAVYEPPFSANGIATWRVQQLFDELERGDLASALLDSLLAADTAPPLMKRPPRPVARLVARLVLAVDDRGSRPTATFRQLLPGVRFDFHDVSQMDGRMHELAAVTRAVLLLSGTAGPAFLRQAIRDLRGVLPDVEHIELEGLGHDGPWNGGDPVRVAKAVEGFLRALR